MGLFDFLNKKAESRKSIPREMLLRFLPSGQVVWMPDNTETLLKEGYLGNHAVFTIQDWKSQKIASAPRNIYEVVDQKAYSRYRLMMKGATEKSLFEAERLKRKGLREVTGQVDLQKTLDRPNNLMSWYEFVYGLSTFKDMVGSGYIGATRDGVGDATKGAIREMELLPSQHVVITAGDRANPIKSYHLKTNPEVKIAVENVCQIRHFDPRYDVGMQWLYGLSRLYPARDIIQEYKESTATKVNIFQDKGVRDIIFPKGVTDPGEISVTEAQSAEDNMNRKLTERGGIITNSIELGSIRVGFSPVEMGILESQAVTKEDFCALYHIPAEVIGWGDKATYSNMDQFVKQALINSVLPELEQLKDRLNEWYVPSYEDTKQPLNNQGQKFVIDFDHEYFPEMQQDKKALVDWLERSPVSVNEFRAAIRYDEDPDENANKPMIRNGYKFLEDMGIESLASGDTSMFEDNDK
ncbi:phage portal protein [Pedobacter sp.]|uniref:phage portal protein n=1 Tax=Pedobacter sp. TaxID=1411316 RepID=UPI003C3C549C